MTLLAGLRNWIARKPLALYAGVLFLAVVPLALFSYSARSTLTLQARSQSLRENSSMARLGALLIENHFEGSVSFLESIARRRRLQQALAKNDLREMRRHLAEAFSLRDDFSFFSLYTHDGTLLTIEPNDPAIVSRNFAFRDWYQGVSRRWNPYVSEVYRTAAAPNPLMVAVAVPVRGEDGSVIGILMAPHRLDVVSGWLRDIQGQAERTVTVFDQKGQILAHPEIDVLRSPVSLKDFEPVRRALRATSGAGVFSRDGRELYVGYHPISSLSWGVVAEQPAAVVLRSLAAIDSRLMIIALFFGGFAVAGAVLLSSMYRKVRETRDQLRQANDGLEARVQERTAKLREEMLERERIQKALAENESRYRDLFENANDVIFTIDLAGRFTTLNQAGERISGYTRAEAFRMTIADVIAPTHRMIIQNEIMRLLSGKSARTVETLIVSKSGGFVPLEVNGRMILQDGKPIGIEGVARDITDRKKLEDKLQQSQRMEAVGRLAGGVAHDFNNILTSILGYADLLLTDLPDDHPMRPDIFEIKRAGDRGSALTRQLLTFGRSQAVDTKVLNLNEVLSGLDSMLRRLIREDIQLVTRTAKDLGNIEADSGKIEQVIVNLIVNARDAMPGGGKLAIETANMDLDEDYARQHAGVSPGRYVLLAVSDTGIGMDAETQAHIFEPFFSTKEKGKGTGLGLATVYGIVKQFDGHIWVYSEPDHGTTFKIYLPRTERPVDSIQPTPAAVESSEGSAHILLVEDTNDLRNLARRTLEKHGYVVIEARNGREAIEICDNHSGKIDLLLSDVVMPEMNGPDLAKQALSRFPQLKILFMSGYTEGTVSDRGALAHSAAFLQKPFSPSDLVNKVRLALGMAGTQSEGGR